MAPHTGHLYLTNLFYNDAWRHDRQIENNRSQTKSSSHEIDYLTEIATFASPFRDKMRPRIFVVVAAVAERKMNWTAVSSTL